MKIVILGGGIAGLAFAAIMQKKGHKVVINERCESIPLGGNAFMMHKEGLELLPQILGENNGIDPFKIDNFILKRQDDSVVMNTPVDSWQCMKRADLITALTSAVQTESIKYNRAFSHFIYDNHNAVAAVFENGDVETGDIFVGADGCHSQVRQLLFGETEFSKVEVQEILGVVKNETLVKKLNGAFVKYQDAEKGLSFGCMALSEKELIWFNQFDVNLSSKKLTIKNDLKVFAHNALADFPELVQDILNETDFEKAYLWNTKDFDALSTFHAGNVVLIGDAAHVSLPFTSAGTTNALLDAVQLSASLENNNTFNAAFNEFYINRIETIKEHIELGRRLKNAFLHPQESQSSVIEIPLIKSPVVKAPTEKSNDKLEIVYFTDPICSTCWTIQPQLRTLKHAYFDNINLKYVMGGLLPSWNNFNRGGITKPEDVAEHWRDVALESGMPIDGSLWLNNPLQSSYPPSIAFKAAQFQDADKALLFLRRLNELVFMESKNISKASIIKTAAIQSGLDATRLFNDMRHRAYAAFEDDVKYSESLGIDSLPTFLFKVNDINMEFLYGNQTFETFEKTILKYAPYTPKSPPMKSVIDVFKKYPSITHHELKLLTNTNDVQADKMLDELLKFGLIVNHQTKAGSIFLSNTKTRAFFV